MSIQISENEQREPFTFSEKMDFARLLEEIESAKANERIYKGKRSDDPVDTRPQGHGKVRDIVGEKINMSGRQYDRAKYVAEKATPEIIEELDRGERKIGPTYDELKAKETVKKASAKTVREKRQEKHETELEDEIDDSDEEEENIEMSKPDTEQKSYETFKMAGLLSKADEDAIQRNKEFNAMSPTAKVKELQRQLKEERVRAVRAESELANLKDLHHNAVYHKDSIINNLEARLTEAEARIQELESLYCPDEVSAKNHFDEIPFYE